MSSPESRLKPDHEIQLSGAAGVAQPAGSESKQGPNTTTPSQAESLLAAEKRTLEMLANGASLSEVLNDLCASIDAHAAPVTSMVCLMDGEWLSPCAGRAPRFVRSGARRGGFDLSWHSPFELHIRLPEGGGSSVRPAPAEASS
jgi:hypothetical protein